MLLLELCVENQSGTSHLPFLSSRSTSSSNSFQQEGVAGHLFVLASLFCPCTCFSVRLLHFPQNLAGHSTVSSFREARCEFDLYSLNMLVFNFQKLLGFLKPDETLVMHFFHLLILLSTKWALLIFFFFFRLGFSVCIGSSEDFPFIISLIIFLFLFSLFSLEFSLEKQQAS